MLRVYECISGQHDLRFVIVAGVICLFACFTAISLLGRARPSAGRARHLWILAAAIVGGSGIWATHFVAMLAFLQDFPVSYDAWLTILSIGIAISLTWCGFFIALDGRGAAPAGGAIAGLAVSSMHYVGMAAVRAPAEPQWDPWFVVSSILIGVVLVGAGLKMGAASAATVWIRLKAGSIYALGIVSMHFTAMAAVQYVPDPSIPIVIEWTNPEWLSLAVAMVTVLIIAFGFVGSIVDQRLADRLSREAERLQQHVDELEATKKELEETARNLTLALDQAAASSQAKSQFLATMSHELRTPLNAVIGFSELMSREIYGPLGDDRYREYATSICDSGAHLLGLINDLLDVSRLDTGKLELSEEELDLRQLTEDAAQMIRGQAEEAGLDLSVELERDLPHIRGDGRRIRQVLINLLSNAVKFTPGGGSIEVRGRQDEAGVSVIVSDTGIGIAEQDIPRALERFGQVDLGHGRRFDGAGLGLPLSKSLMELHDGTLTLESALGRGTTVTVTFPAERLLEKRKVA